MPTAAAPTMIPIIAGWLSPPVVDVAPVAALELPRTFEAAAEDADEVKVGVDEVAGAEVGAAVTK